MVSDLGRRLLPFGLHTPVLTGRGQMSPVRPLPEETVASQQLYERR